MLHWQPNTNASAIAVVACCERWKEKVEYMYLYSKYIVTSLNCIYFVIDEIDYNNKRNILESSFDSKISLKAKNIRNLCMPVPMLESNRREGSYT